MPRLVAALVVVALVLTVAVPAARAGTATNVALGLASLAVFTQLFGGYFLRPACAYPVYYSAPVVVGRPAYYAPPAYGCYPPAPASP